MFTYHNFYTHNISLWLAGSCQSIALFMFVPLLYAIFTRDGHKKNITPSLGNLNPLIDTPVAA